jgi:dihydroorotate dehydrogenase (NAD+) catalytic subunit
MEMIMAGATAVGIGSAVEREGESVFGRVLSELTSLMTEFGIRDLRTIRGCAHV